MNIQEMMQSQKAALVKAEGILATAENAGRSFTASEQTNYDHAMAEYADLGKKIQARQSQSTLTANLRGNLAALIAGGGDMPVGFTQPLAAPVRLQETRTAEYGAALRSFLATGGKAASAELIVGADGNGGYHLPHSEQYTRQRRANGTFDAPRMGAAMYEGTDGSSTTSGGYAISVPTVEQIVPLAMPDLGIFDAATVIPTATNIKIPQQTAFGASALKSESTGTVATFGGSDPTLGQIELSAWMAGALRMVSWELLQDVEAWQQFVIDDLIKGQRILEDSLLATGTGSSQPQGVFGNTGTGSGTTYALTGTASTDATLLLESLFDTAATLKAGYQANASWIMARSTGLAIRRAQMLGNLFVPVATTDPDGTERILGKPVFYDVNAPALPTATTTGAVPILFGDFKQGYIVGVRGGSGINVKILDQPWAAQGQLGILAYRRLDGKVRRSEAIQQIKVSHS